MIYDPISLYISITALIISVIIAIRQITIVKQSNFLPVLIDLFREFRSSDFKKHYSYILTKLQKQHNSKKGFTNLSEPAKTHVRVVSHFYDNLGVLIAYNIIDEKAKKAIIIFMGESITRTWKILQPYILNERKFRKSEFGYQEFFENLVVQVYKNPAKEERKRMNLQKLEV